MSGILWEGMQLSRINAANTSASRASSQAQKATEQNLNQEHIIDKLLLVNRAMWEIMQKHMPVDDEMLLTKMHEIDLRDGYEDGKLNKNVVRQCRSCGRTLNRHHTKCLYCGSRDLASDPFDIVK